jgi:hypothetical protein
MGTLSSEKAKMVSEWDYYRKPNGDVDCVVNRRTLVFLYGSQAVGLLSYLRTIHRVQLLPRD